MRALRGVVFALLGLLSVALVSPVVLVPALLVLLPLRPAAYRAWCDLVAGSWHVWMTALVHRVMNTRMRFTGDALPSGDRCVVLANHRTRLDWMFLWGFFVWEGRAEHLKIALKHELKKIPPFAWPLQTCGYWFFTRRWERDEPYLRDVMRHYTAIRYPLQLLLFPEGTDLTSTTLARSNAFAEKQGLPPLKHVLYPREAGFTYIVGTLRNKRSIDAVYDLTLAYSSPVPQTETAIFTGFPDEIHVHIRRYDVNALPNDEKLGEWLRERWVEKETRLEAAAGRKEALGDQHTTLHSPEKVAVRELAHLALWLAATFILGYLFLTSSVVFYYILLSWGFLHAGTLYGDGIDAWERAWTVR